jgi:hypothetical protein
MRKKKEKMNEENKSIHLCEYLRFRFQKMRKKKEYYTIFLIIIHISTKEYTYIPVETLIDVQQRIYL